MKRLILLFVISLVGAAQAFIDDGIKAPQNSFPHVVKITTSQQDKITSICTGTLVAPDIVVSAAHCINLDPGQTQIINGVKVIRSFSSKAFWEYRKQCTNLTYMVKLPLFERKSAAEKESILQKWSERCGLKRSSDIAFFQLEKGLQNIATAALGCRSNLAPQTEVMIAGFGLNNLGNREALLHFGSNFLVQKSPSVYTIKKLPGKQISNRGDSGGPLFLKGDASVVYGVTSSSDDNNSGMVLEADYAKLSSLNAFAIYDEVLRMPNVPLNLRNILMSCLK